MPTAEDFLHIPLQMWEEVLSKVKKAVVFMDDKCVESLHWCGGAAAVLEAGARNLKQFSSFEACGVNEPKAVFVVSTLLKGRTVDIIKDIISLSHFQYCVVFTTVAHSVHLLANNVTADMEGNPVFEQFEEKLCEWMGNMNYTAEVMYVPAVFAPVSQQLLLTPAFAHLFPLLPPDLAAINARRPEKKKFGNLADLDVHSLPLELQITLKSLASALNSMFEATGTKEESFAVGPMSRILAGELASHPQAKQRRKTAPNKASIIFVDRTMDLTGTICTSSSPFGFTHQRSPQRINLLHPTLFPVSSSLTPNNLHILSHYIFKSSLWSSSRPPARQLQFQGPINIFTIPPPHDPITSVWLL